jgi:purine-binding chemotaxis protein CheW
LASTEFLPDVGLRRLVLFRLAERVYGIELGTVREIIPFRRATRLPGAPDYVSGLINVRGSIVTVIDLGARLDERTTGRQDGSVILVEHGGKVIGLAVDEVMDVQALGADAIQAASADSARGGSVRGLGHLGDQVVILLDIDTIIRHVLL